MPVCVHALEPFCPAKDDNKFQMIKVSPSFIKFSFLHYTLTNK